MEQFQLQIKIDSKCQSCSLEGKSINHVFFLCPVARHVWAISNFPCPKNGFDNESIYQNMFYVLVVGKNLGVPLKIRMNFLLDLMDFMERHK